MEFARFEIRNDSGLFKKSYMVFDDNEILKFHAKYSSMWMSQIDVFDEWDTQLFSIDKNVWSNKFMLYRLKKGSKNMLAVIKSSAAAMLKLKIDSQELGYLELTRTKLLKGEFILRNPEAEEIAIYVRKSSGLKRQYGIAAKENKQVELIVAIGLIIAWLTDLGAL